MKKKVLVLDDEASIRSFVVINLKRVGYEVVEAECGEQALTLLNEQKDIGVALLDIMLPDIDGFEVCRRIRGNGSKIGIIMLTSKAQEVDRVTGLMTGADDYVTKPFSPTELIARIDALFRRLGDIVVEDTSHIKSGPFVLDTKRRTLDKNGVRIKLTQIEYALMKFFMENPNEPVSRDDIFAAVWGSEYCDELKIIDVNIRRLRIKIEDDPANPEYIKTERSYGYRWSN